MATLLPTCGVCGSGNTTLYPAGAVGLAWFCDTHAPSDEEDSRLRDWLMQEIPQFGPQLSQSYAHIVDLISKPGTDCDMMFSLGRRWEALKQNATISALKEMLRKYTCDGLECGTCYECEKQHTKYAEEERNQIKFDYVTDVPLEPMPEPNPLEAKQRADIARALADLNRPGGRRW